MGPPATPDRSIETHPNPKREGESFVPTPPSGSLPGPSPSFVPLFVFLFFFFSCENVVVVWRILQVLFFSSPPRIPPHTSVEPMHHDPRNAWNTPTSWCERAENARPITFPRTRTTWTRSRGSTQGRNPSRWVRRSDGRSRRRHTSVRNIRYTRHEARLRGRDAATHRNGGREIVHHRR